MDTRLHESIDDDGAKVAQARVWPAAIALAATIILSMAFLLVRAHAGIEKPSEAFEAIDGLLLWSTLIWLGRSIRRRSVDRDRHQPPASPTGRFSQDADKPADGGLRPVAFGLVGLIAIVGLSSSSHSGSIDVIFSMCSFIAFLVALAALIFTTSGARSWLLLTFYYAVFFFVGLSLNFALAAFHQPQASQLEASFRAAAADWVTVAGHYQASNSPGRMILKPKD